MSAVNAVVVALGSGGALATLASTISAWATKRQSKGKRPVTLRITRNDGSSIFLDAETVKTLDPDTLKIIMAEILPDEPEEYPDEEEEEDSDEQAESHDE